MKRILFSACLVGIANFCAFNVNAQAYVNKVLVLNEGRYDYVTSTIDIPVTLGVYDPQTKMYTSVDTINGVRFASDLLVVDDYILIAADNKLIKKDKNTYQTLHTATVSGIRKLAVNEGKVYVSRGEYLQSFDSYLHIYSLADLTLLSAIDTISGPKYASEGLAVYNSKVYVAVNNGFEWGNEKGLIGIYNTTTNQYENEISLLANGLNPDNVMLSGDKLYTLNNKDFSGSSVSEIDLTSNTVATADLNNVSSGCGTSAFYEDAVIYQEMGANVVYSFNPSSQLTDDSLVWNKTFYGICVDEINDIVYASETDFVSEGKVFIYQNKLLVDSFSVSVSPGNIALDSRDNTSVSELKNSTKLSVFPNPAAEFVNIYVDNSTTLTTSIHTISGQLVTKENIVNGANINTAHLQAGVYLLTVSTATSNFTQKLVIK